MSIPEIKAGDSKVRHFFATESSYGSTADLKQFIDECHGRGIRVIINGIYKRS